MKRVSRSVGLSLVFALALSAHAVQPMLAGGEHTLALRNDGTVFAFGSDSGGQLGQGSLAQSPTPVQARGLSGVAAISMGLWHALAVKTDGTVWGWGYSERGQIGDGSLTVGNVPVRARGLTGAVAVAAGPNHSVTLKSDGTVWAWGKSNSGQLGIAYPGDVTTPVPVPNIGGVASIRAGGDFTVALKGDGTVWAWGRNLNGQLGAGAGEDRSSPAPVSGLAGITAIAVGAGHTVALRSDGTVWTWGSNAYGQLGDGTRVDRLVPVQVPGLGVVSAIGAGLGHTLAIKSDGTVWAWGWNVSGQLGDGTATDRSVPVQVFGLGGSIVAIAGGYAHSVAIGSDGGLWAWGANNAGQLGDGTTLARSSPVQVARSLAGATRIRAGGWNTVALKADGTVWSWGMDGYGQLGNGGATSRTVPATISAFGSVTKIAAHGANSLALKSDGTVWSWGTFFLAPMANDVFASGTPAQVPGLSGVTAIATGGTFSMALTPDGTVRTWGWNGFGQLGDGTTSDRATPVAIAGLTGVAAIAAGRFHALALKSDGTVWGWGRNDSSEVGVAPQAACSNLFGSNIPCNPVPARIPGLNSVIAVATGNHRSLALKGDGTVWTWGTDWLGTSDSTVPVQAQGLTGVAAIGAYESYASALLSNGTVWAWGRLNSGFGSAVPVQVQGLSGVAAIAVGDNAAFAVKPDGTLWSWGANIYGNLGDGTYSPRASPVLVANETADGPLDLIPEVANSIPADKIPPFFLAATKSGGLSATTLYVDLKGGTGRGTFAESGRFAATYNVYVAAYAPALQSSGAPLWWQLDGNRNWGVLSAPMAEYLRGAALDSQTTRVRADILQNADLSQLIGTVFYVGYGTDTDEMLRAGRYRDIFTVPSQ